MPSPAPTLHPMTGRVVSLNSNKEIWRASMARLSRGRECLSHPRCKFGREFLKRKPFEMDSEIPTPKLSTRSRPNIGVMDNVLEIFSDSPKIQGQKFWGGVLISTMKADRHNVKEMFGTFLKILLMSDHVFLCES